MLADWDKKYQGKIYKKSFRDMGKSRILIYEAHMPLLSLKAVMMLRKQYHKWMVNELVVIVSLLNQEVGRV